MARETKLVIHHPIRMTSSVVLLALLLFPFMSAYGTEQHIFSWDGGQACQNLTVNASLLNILNVSMPDMRSKIITNATLNMTGYPYIPGYSGVQYHKPNGDFTTPGVRGNFTLYWPIVELYNPEYANDMDWDTYARIFLNGTNAAYLYNINYSLNNSYLIDKMNVTFKLNINIGTGGISSRALQCWNFTTSAYSAIATAPSTNGNHTFITTITPDMDCIQDNLTRFRLVYSMGNGDYANFSIYDVEVNYSTNSVYSYPEDVRIVMNNSHEEYSLPGTFPGFARDYMNLTFQNEYYAENMTMNYNFSSTLFGYLYACIENISYIGNSTRVTGINYSGVKQFNGTNYTRDFQQNVTYICDAGHTAYYEIYVDNNLYSSTALTCNDVQNAIYRTVSAAEGSRAIKQYFNDTTNTGYSGWVGENSSFYYDNANPEIQLNFSITAAFGVGNGTINVTCVDSAYTPIYYNVTFNGDQAYAHNVTNNTLVTISHAMTNGYNTAVGYCSDLFGTSNVTVTNLLSIFTLILINEKENIPFDPANITGARAYFDDNSTYFNFKNPNASSTSFSAGESIKLRIELTYLSGDVIIRYVDTGLNVSDVLRICANKEGIIHYEQILLSSQQRAIKLQNVYANCTVAQDYTRFSYQDNKILKAYTINSNYNLYYLLNGAWSLLASLDGSIATYHNIDVLQFNSERQGFGIGSEALAFNKVNDDVVEITYKNTYNTSAYSTLNITRQDTGVNIYSTSFITTPDSWIVYFNHSLVSLNATTILQARVDRYDDQGNQVTFKRYFTLEGKSGLLPAAVGFAIAILLTLFGFFLASTKYSFSWFGIIVLLGAIGILAYSVQTWYVVLFMVMEMVIILYVGILMVKNKALQVT